MVNDLMLLESLLDNLMARQKDTSARVRRLVLRGLANVALGSPDKVTVGQPSRALLLGKGGRAEPQLVRRLGETQQPQARRVGSWAAGCGMAWAHRCVWPPQVRTHGPQLLTAMIGGLDDGDDPHSLVALEAMVGLARLMDLVDAWDLRAVLLHIAVRIRPFFDSVGPPPLAVAAWSTLLLAPTSLPCGCPGSWAGRAW